MKLKNSTKTASPQIPETSRMTATRGTVRLSIIIPAKNEGAVIGDVVSSVGNHASGCARRGQTDIRRR